MPSGRQEEFWKQKHSNETGWHASMLYGQKYGQENVPKERKYPVNSSSVGKNVAWFGKSQFLVQHSDVGSEFGVNNMKAWIHPDLSQWFRLVVV